MNGQLAMTNGVYSYKERIFHGNPGPQNRGDEITSSVCREVKPQAQDEQKTAKRPFRVVDASDGFLAIRKGPGTQYELVTRMPMGAIGLVGRCVPLEAPWKPFCEVEWQGVTGWASSCCMADLDQSTSPSLSPRAQVPLLR